MKTLCRLTAIVLIALCAVAEDHPNSQKGFVPGDLYQFNDLDAVNLFNGNLNLHLPLGQTYVVDGALSYRFGVSYSGNNWEFKLDEVSCEPTTDPTCSPDGPNARIHRYKQALLPRERKWNAGLGWLLSFGQINFTKDTNPFRVYPESYTSPDGADHRFFTTLHEGETAYGTLAEPTVLYTRDGTYLRVKKIFYTNPYGVVVPGWELEFPGGSIHRFGGDGRVMHMRDRFGNMVTFDYESQSDLSPKWTITEQGARRTQVVEFKRIPVPGATQFDPQFYDVVKTVKLSSAGSAPAVYTFHYGDAASCDPSVSNSCELVRISRAMPCSDPRLGKTVQVPLLRSITLPDGSSYSMNKPGNVPDYDLGDQIDLSDHYAYPPENQRFSGHITGLKLPTGGKLEWSYQPYHYPEDSPIMKRGVFGGEVWELPMIHTIGVRERRQLDAEGTVLSKTVYDTLMVNLSLPLQPIPPRVVMNTITALTPANAVISKTVNYFSIDSRLQNRPFYGRPFTPEPDPENDGPSDVTNPDPQGRYLSSKTYDGAGQLQRYTYVRYETDGGGENGRMSSEKTVYRTDGDRWHATDHSDFDGLGHYRTSVFTGNFGGGGDLRTSHTAYNKRDSDVDPGAGPNVGTWGSNFQMLLDTDPWILNTYSSQQTTENGITAKALFCFDWSTGFLRRQRTMSSTTPAGSDLITRYTSTNGNVTREESFGGDAQTVPTAPLCSATLPGAVYQTDSTYSNGALAATTYLNIPAAAPMPFKSADRDINAGTGLVMTARDTAGVATSYEYDDMGRLLWVKPAGSAWTEYVYKRAGQPDSPNATVLINQRPAGNPNGLPLTESRIEFDALGRVWKEHQRMPSGAWSVRETRYHPAGWTERVSELETTPSKWTVFSDFDAFGRAGKITSPDLSATLIAHGGERTTTRTKTIATPTAQPTSVTTVQEYDAQGRLVKVIEKSGPTTATSAIGANVVTEYTYDVGNHLSTVTMRGAEAGGVIQYRQFHYDRRGLLTSESHPESGLVAYTYDARGHVLSKSHSGGGSPFDLQFAYDSAERLRRVEARNALYDPTSIYPDLRLPWWLMKEFEYAADNDLAAEPDDLRKGKLLRAFRYNYPAYPDPPAEEILIRVGETYRYKDTAGRKTERTTNIEKVYGSSWQTIKSIDQKAVYNELGLPERISYPVCIDCGLPATNRETDYTYLGGRVRTVGGFLSDVSYWPNGMRNVQVHTNGVADTQAVDGSGMARPGSISSGLYNSCNAPVISAQPEGGELTSSTPTVTLTVIASGTGLRYQWYRGFSQLAGETSPSLIVTAADTYVVDITNACKTVRSRQVTVTATNCTPPAANDSSVTRHADGTVTLAVVTSGTEPHTVTWHNYNGDAPVGNGRTITIGPITQTTTYYAKVVNRCGEDRDDPVTVAIAYDMPAGGLVATRNGGDPSRIDVSWPAGPSGSQYTLERRNGSAWTEIAAQSGTTFADVGLAANKTFAYRVRVGGGAYSNVDIASTMSFTPVSPGLYVQAAHFDQLLGAVNSVRAAAGWPSVSWAGILNADQPPVATGGPILGAYIASLRARMNEALQALGAPAPPYVDPDFNGRLFRAAYITELQQRVQ